MTRKPTFLEFFLSLITCQVYQPNLEDDQNNPELQKLKKEGKMKEYFLKKYNLTGDWVKDGVTYSTDNMDLIYRGAETHRPGRMSMVPQDFYYKTAVALWKHKSKGTFFKTINDDGRSYPESLSEQDAQQQYIMARHEGTTIFEKTFKETFGHEEEIY